MSDGNYIVWSSPPGANGNTLMTPATDVDKAKSLAYSLHHLSWVTDEHGQLVIKYPCQLECPHCETLTPKYEALQN